MFKISNPLARVPKKTRLYIAITLSFCFFVAEISFGFYTRSLALVADGFHVLFDLISFAIALAAIIVWLIQVLYRSQVDLDQVSERSQSPQGLSFGWQRAQLLGSFFNGVFQLALGFSIFLMSLERFIYVECR